jgi:hypothetical protein
VQGQQLLPKGEVLQKESFSGAKDGDDPSPVDAQGAQTSGNHGEKRAAQCTSKSLILRTRRVLARHSLLARPVALLASSLDFLQGTFEKIHLQRLFRQNPL